MTREAGIGAEAWVTALSTLPGLGPRTLCRVLAHADPRALWMQLCQGSLSALASSAASASGMASAVASAGVDVTAARAAAQATDVEAVWSSHRAAGIGVTWVGSPTYPAGLADDPAAPGVLFHLGDLSRLGARPTVAIVGTRSATRYGLGVAAQLGADLAATGVSVLSGLALGIDGAAHEGACAGCEAAHEAGGPPIGVVAGGLDSPYPARHAGLWGRVASAGVIVSTSPMGTALEPGRFPQRNRLLAALCDVAVVVESHHAGGALSTALDAAERGRPVGAVPGSIRSLASAGANDLLADGAFVVRDVADVQMALGMVAARSDADAVSSRRGAPTGVGLAAASRAVAAGGRAAVATAADRDGDRTPSGSGVTDAAEVMGALGSERCSLDQLARRTGFELPRLCAVLEALAAEGRLVGEGGWWEHV